MNKIIKITALLLSASFLLVSCSNNNVVQKDELLNETEQGNSTNVAKEDKAQVAEGEVMVDLMSKTHTFEPAPARVEQRELSYKERFTGMLQAHNKVRAKHNIAPLKWSKKLEDYSMQWAKQLSKGNKCEMYHRPNTTPFGENLYRSTAIVWTDGKREVNPVTIKDVVKAWTDEEKWYNYKRNSCKPGVECGHYTQAVWKTTTEVGCAMQVCGDKSQTWVCSYNPPGNYVGLRPY